MEECIVYLQLMYDQLLTKVRATINAIVVSFATNECVKVIQTLNLITTFCNLTCFKSFY